jgi:Uma2 family endonuclease
MAAHDVKTRRWTRAEYERLIELGIFAPEERIELIGGDLMVAEPQSAWHYTAIRKVARTLGTVFGPEWDVRTQGPMALDDESEPEPDVAVVSGAIEDYRDAHPSRSVLMVEVSESSLRTDRKRKGSLYARAGLTDYWVLNLVDRVLEVYRQPIPDEAALFGWRYAQCDVLRVGAAVTPLAASSVRIEVADLLL